MNDTQKTVISSLAAETQDDGIVLCPQCGKTVKRQTGHIRRFCSDRCRMTYWNNHPELISRRAYYSLVCQFCGRPFQSYGNAHRKFCCRSCYDHYRKKKKHYDEQA